jgi:hypothetical protein
MFFRSGLVRKTMSPMVTVPVHIGGVATIKV